MTGLLKHYSVFLSCFDETENGSCNFFLKLNKDFTADPTSATIYPCPGVVSSSVLSDLIRPFVKKQKTKKSPKKLPFFFIFS